MRVVTPGSPGWRSLPLPRIDAVTQTGFVVSCFAFSSEQSTSAAAPSPIGEHIRRVSGSATIGELRMSSTVYCSRYCAYGLSEAFLWLLTAILANCIGVEP